MHVTPSAAGRRQLRLFITGAAGQLGSAIVARFADCDLVCPSSAALDIARRRGRAAGGGHGDAGPHRELRGVQRRRRRRGSAAGRPGGQRVRGADSGARGGGLRGDAGSLRHRFRVRRHGVDAVRRSGAAGAAQRVRGLEAARRMVRAGGADAPTSCASRACSASRARSPAVVAPWRRSCAASRRIARFRSSPIGSSRPATSSTSPPRRVIWSRRRRHRVSITASTRVPRGGSRSQRSWRGRWVSRRGCARSRAIRCRSRPARPVYSALSTAKLAAAGFAMPDWRDAVCADGSRRATRRSLIDRARRVQGDPPLSAGPRGRILPRGLTSMNKRALITGITGQDGSYLAELLLDQGLRRPRHHPAHLDVQPAAHRGRPGQGVWRRSRCTTCTTAISATRAA